MLFDVKKITFLYRITNVHNKKAPPMWHLFIVILSLLQRFLAS